MLYTYGQIIPQTQICYNPSVEITQLVAYALCMNDKEFLVKLGKRVAEVRKEKGMTQEQLAEIVGLHRTYIGFIGQGKRNALVGNIYKISKALNISLTELFSTIN